MELTVLFWNVKKMTVGPVGVDDFGAGWLTHFREERAVANPLKVEFQFDFGSPNAYLEIGRAHV